jgi:hypothetical protein
MWRQVGFCASCILLGIGSLSCQNPSMPISIIQLIANPQEFSGKPVSVQGFLRIGRERHHGWEAVLYLHREDAENMLTSNVIGIEPSEQMIRDQEKLDRMYVRLSGVVHVVQTANGSSSVSIGDVESCGVWSNPSHPVGLDANDRPEK